MARPSKTAAIVYTAVHDLTHGLLERATCPEGLPFVLVRDADKKGLRLRVTKAGGKHWQFETRLKNSKLFTRALGEWPTISINDAKAEAHRLRGLTEKGQDPRELERQQLKDQVAVTANATAQAITVGDIWPRYLAEGRPKRKDAWKPGYRASLEVMSSPGGVKKNRGQGLTRPGPIYPLLSLTLVGVTEDALQIWFEAEAESGRHQATRALMMFRGFLRWCAGRPEYRRLINRDAGKAPAILENLPTNKKRTDVLGVAQLPGWWKGAEQLTNRTASVYLRALLLTGARKEELAALTWAHVDFQWQKLTLPDKVDHTRTIPLTPYLAQLIATLPLINSFVFASTSKTGRISDARSSHTKVLQSAGIDHLTFHGLRRTFVQRGRSVVPAGAVAQITGHKPSATAEGYAVLPLDDLRPYAVLVESWILEKAEILFNAVAEQGQLQLSA